MGTTDRILRAVGRLIASEPVIANLLALAIFLSALAWLPVTGASQ